MISGGHRIEDILSYSLGQTKRFYEAIQKIKMDDRIAIIKLVGGTIK